MNLADLSPAVGSKQKAFRVGRGHGSGNGKTAGRGHKGQKARSGGGVRRGFEGGQMPLYRRLPKKGSGFKNINTKEIIAINLEHLNRFEEGDVVTVSALQAKGLVSNPRDGVKILGVGELSKKLTVQVNYYSKSAAEKIEAAGGKAEVI
ncbi:MAG: 50S ribosomal protein L15 [Defluviitaleaceae bacterium]|nr:50S ribosomal protein L15 [Defluviitaleaceae bacterium]